MNGEWAREYETPGEILSELRASGVECSTEGNADSTMYSEWSLFCYTNETRDDGYDVAIYASGQQQGEAHVYLTDLNPGARYVWGTGWSVRLPSGSDGSEVTTVIGGEVG